MFSVKCACRRNPDRPSRAYQSIIRYIWKSYDMLERSDIPMGWLTNQAEPHLQYTKAVVPPKYERREEWDICDLRITPDKILKKLINDGGIVSFNDLLENPQGVAMPDYKENHFIGKKVLTEDGKVDFGPSALLDDLHRLMPGVIVVPHGWGQKTKAQRKTFAMKGENINDIIPSGANHMDRVSGQAIMLAHKIDSSHYGAKMTSKIRPVRKIYKLDKKLIRKFKPRITAKINPAIAKLNAPLLSFETDPLLRKNQKYIQKIVPNVGKITILYNNEANL